MNVDQIKSALTPDHHSQSAYTGRVIQKEIFTVPDSEGNPIHVERNVVITWDTIRKILKMVFNRAGV